MTIEDGKGASSEQLWSAFRGPLAGRFRGLGARADEVEDLVQESFLRIHAGLQGLREPSRIAGWVHRIAHNVWVDAHRSRRESNATTLESGAAKAAEPERERGDEGFAAEVGRWLLAGMGDLDATTREVLHRFELEGESQQGIADELGLSLSAVKARVLRGRAQMRKRLERCCEFEFDRAGQPIEARRRAGPAPACGGSDSSECSP